MNSNIKELTLEELQKTVSKWQQPVFRAGQIFAWVYKKGIKDFNEISNIPLALKKQLKEEFCLFQIKAKEILTSSDGTKKLLLQLIDNNCIEAVIIPAGARVTGCVSTQVGCKFACGFCASGLSGFERNLTTAEIIEQALYLKEYSETGKLTHIVFMGMGEPLDNYDNLLKAIRIINSEYSLNIGARRITISTCGIIPGINKLANEGLQVELSISLHAADDAVRNRLMPVNKKYPLADLMAACRDYYTKTNRQITFEYVLIKDLNSDLQNAAKLSKIIQGFDCKINLIPCNYIKELGLEPPNKIDFLRFRDYLIKNEVQVTLRRGRGEDIHSACGQLRLYYEKKD